MPTKPSELLCQFTDLVRQSACALRLRVQLLPAGGDADKVFPPTYLQTDNRGHNQTVYATETRYIDGQAHTCVSLDAVQSQANRLEAALLQANDQGDITLPLLAMHVAGMGRLTIWDMPHRLYDAILLDSIHEGVGFRQSDLGQRLFGARPQRATELYTYCPSVLLFGGWDSHAAGVDQKARFARVLTSEIIGTDAICGVQGASRRDPLGITRSAHPIFVAQDPRERWTLDETQAVMKRDRHQRDTPALFKGDGLPSRIGHGNIAPSLKLGGVSIRAAHQIAVISLPKLRCLQFPDVETGGTSPERNTAAQTVIAALGLYALALQYQQGYDLRARCFLVPTSPLQFDYLAPGSVDAQPLNLDVVQTYQLLSAALQQAESHGLYWCHEPIWLEPKPGLYELIRRSNAIAPGEEPPMDDASC